MAFQFDAPQEGDRSERKSGGLPPFKVLNYKSGKTGELAARSFTAETAKGHFANGEIGFSFYDKEMGTINVQEGTFALLGLYWKLSTYNGGQNKNGDRWTSNMVLDIRRDEMQIYKNGEITNYKGTYRDLKEKNLWSKETKIGMYWVMMELESEKLYAIELTNTVKNGFKRSVLKAYSKPITGQSLEREGLFGLFDSPENFHCFTLLGANLANEKGMPYKGEKGEGDSYFMPHFGCQILRKERAPEMVEKLNAARSAFFSALAERQVSASPVLQEAKAQPIEQAEEKEESLSDLLSRHGAGQYSSGGTSTAQKISAAKRDPFADEVDDMPF